jgi:hypothetical protein
VLPPELFDPEAWHYALEGLRLFDHHDALRMASQAVGIGVSKGAVSAGYRGLAQKGPLSGIGNSNGIAAGTLRWGTPTPGGAASPRDAKKRRDRGQMRGGHAAPPPAPFTPPREPPGHRRNGRAQAAPSSATDSW